VARAVELLARMKLEHEAPDGLFVHHAKLKQLERQLFAHAREVGDLRNLSAMEQVLYCVLSDEIDEELALDLSRVLVIRAVEHVLHDPERDITSVPHGISRAERMAAFFEEGCPFCEARVDRVEEIEDVDDCECCTMLVREWRAKHADALHRYSRPPSRAANH
jgi:hypothetical protein